MSTSDFSITLITEQSPQEVFNSIKNVRAWWSGLYGETFEGESEKLNDEFSYWAGDGAHYSKQKLIELVPDKKIVWLVTDSKLNFLKDKTEWTNTKLCFEVSEKDNKTQICFTHFGLLPKIECFDICSTVWTQYLQEGLLPLVASAKK